MYGLTQAGIIYNNILTKRLQPKGYLQCRHTTGLWKQKQHPTMFSLVVNDFGVQHVGRKHEQHLIDSIKKFMNAELTGVAVYTVASN